MTNGYLPDFIGIFSSLVQCQKRETARFDTNQIIFRMSLGITLRFVWMKMSTKGKKLFGFHMSHSVVYTQPPMDIDQAPNH